MSIRNKLIKIADLFDQAGESGIADAIDETLTDLDKKESNDLMMLEPKTLDNFSEEEKNTVRAFMVLFFPELEDKVGKELADDIESMIANHIG